MWSQILLCLLVGLAFASENPGWNNNYHYVYEVRGRSLAGLNQVSNEYSGIIFKAQLYIQPRSDGNLGAKISNAQYAKIHEELSEGWETEIPDSQVSYQQLPLSSKPFQIGLYKGVIRNVMVDKQIKNWEANMIKSIVSQLQLDTKATNLIPSSINILTQEDSNTAVFKTMEETVTGVCETLYEIHPYPEYVLQSKPWVVPHKHLIEDGDVIEIVKNKNFTHSEQSPSYHAGLDGIYGYQPGNKVGKFLSRTSVSQAVITGTLDKYTVQSSVTVEQIVIRPTLADQKKGSVNSKLNVTLLQVAQPVSENEYDVTSPVDVGVVYAYDSPYSTDNSPRPAKQYDHGVAPGSSESQYDTNQYYGRTKRAITRPNLQYTSFSLDNYQPDSIEEEDWHQDKPHFNEAPASPLLPFTVGFDGQAFKKQKNIIETVRKLAEEIGQEFPHEKEILRQHTVGKFVTLASLVRTMTQSEIQQVASQLYSGKAQGLKSPSWVAFRDAVAQAGTGPALYNIKEWILSGKIDGREAAQVIAVAANAARQPTEEYIKFFNDMIQDEKIMSQQHLNESALLSYTNLVRQVYANRGDSHAKYPVYSFGSFRTTRGQEYVKKNVIPHLTRKLNEAINSADTQKIHIYIRALGNVGHQQILEAFEPYLEGQKKASHFQRVLMVVALDRLVEANPRVARSVLFKIYQNPSEYEQVRVAAVYQLMRTKPTSAMLQRMASYTNVDTSDYVNAAVKSSIEFAADLEAPEHYRFRQAAHSAKPLLTSKQYGVQYSQGYLRNYITKESHSLFEQNLQMLGGEDHAVPRGMKYLLEKQFGGVYQQVINAHAMVSSIEDLVSVFQQQTEEYKRQQQEKQHEQSVNYPWSSENIAKLLHLQNEQREQLEGSLYLQMGALQTIFSFDNHTMENLPELVRKWEDEFRQNKHYAYSKMMIAQESSLALPTVLGLPFIYTYDRPALIRVEGNVKVETNPHISSGDSLKKPDNVNVDFDIHAVISGRVQTQFCIFTPFDHQRYSAGYNKNFQLVVPLNGKMELDVQKKQLKMELQNPGSQESVRLAHYSSWPYTSQGDIYTPKPDLKIIHSQRPHRINTVVGDKSTGVAVYLQITSDHRIDPAFMYERLHHHDLVSAVLDPWIDDTIQYVHIDVGIDSGKSTAQQVNLHLGYKYKYQSTQAQEKNANDQITDIPAFADSPEKRQQEFVDKLGKYINNPHVFVADATADFQGQYKVKYSATFGVAKSNVDPQSRFMGYARKVEKQNPQVLAYVQGVSHVRNTNGLNLDYAMEFDPTSTAYIQGLLRKEQRLSRVDAHIELSKSEQRKEYLKQQEEYKECKHQMQEGNTQLPICAKMGIRANLLDTFSIKMKYSDMDPRVINATYKTYSVLRHFLYPRVEENIVEPSSDNHLDIQGQFSPDLHAVNFSINSEYGNVQVKNVQVNKWYRDLFVSQPVFHARARLQGQALKYDTYRPICVVDKTQTSTWDNKTYPSSFSNGWTVLLHYVPRRPSSSQNKPYESVQEQLNELVESYIVYARASEQSHSQKEIQIVLQMPCTNGKVVKIAMKPSSKGPKVLIDEQEVKYDTEHASDAYDGAIQIYGLPNQEVKLEIRDAFYAIFNGQTLKLTATNSKFRDASRGLCGTFTGEQETDFLGPDNCIIHAPEKFIESYTIGQQLMQRGSKMRRSDNEKQCYFKKVYYANYISNQDAGRVIDAERRGRGSCSKLQTRYVEENGEICFTIRPLPVCKSRCQQRGTIYKNVQVYCSRSTSSTNLWKNEIQKGASPDFSLQQVSKTIQMEMPKECLP
ncbi:Vitellogenin-like Protein [Tribolium castaneum]|uniref:Vitellogenin-like Protein n=1 Tax=Tribolium castaneum TaxID=7070 RepID=D6W721_TRICA|nr:PREDICTED: vitellogenin [Tribolium castaneum]EFA11425.1 Vitellogenin-like Protein [Tribolium castaneum]|eukprot:XP_971398.1 PREDICTED: vitellogenin [Tribolium castaneum]